MEKINSYFFGPIFTITFGNIFFNSFEVKFKKYFNDRKLFPINLEIKTKINDSIILTLVKSIPSEIIQLKNKTRQNKIIKNRFQD